MAREGVHQSVAAPASSFGVVSYRSLLVSWLDGAVSEKAAMSSTAITRVREDRTGSMNSYLRKVIGYTSQTLLEFYRYLLTPPSLEEVVENNDRNVSPSLYQALLSGRWATKSVGAPPLDFILFLALLRLERVSFA